MKMKWKELNFQRLFYEFLLVWKFNKLKMNRTHIPFLWEDLEGMKYVVRKCLKFLF